ncbi:MAG: DUF3944 domain-containing protein [Neisseriaceae bacterium]|nr:DUF3944 domain-containing protein [Neisseriaceae bacterium]MBQ9182360.1 DUF3944 domain-containing protein [Neisseriaceae bacterium]MBQ9723857.1 DUF3944 domain-containing protein [Neisseriaceae bacterium]MBR1819668.1 DUF3944 domain-containing protein [Neisseriaceae bacterium]
MAYRYDHDLQFLGECSSEELRDFAELLIYDKDGTERLTGNMDLAKRYKYQPDCNQYWQELAAEFQLFGGNTFANIARGSKGILYREILRNVFDKMKIKGFAEDKSTEWNEQLFMEKIIPSFTEKMSLDELKKLANELGIENTNNLTPQIYTAAFITLFRSGKIHSYRVIVTVVNTFWRALFGHGLKPVVNASINKTLGTLTGPVGWTFTGVWTAIDIASPAYRVTIPAVLQIIYLRSLNANRNLIKEQEIQQIDNKE